VAVRDDVAVFERCVDQLVDQWMEICAMARVLDRTDHLHRRDVTAASLRMRADDVVASLHDGSLSITAFFRLTTPCGPPLPGDPWWATPLGRAVRRVALVPRTPDGRLAHDTTTDDDGRAPR
jgi:hypothetical protein